ncbi:MAG: hypothetical protein KBG15_17285 [Kofleriaceae bacterium]|nr:hypothetical protein [Kofleriaceae bacterium]
MKFAAFVVSSLFATVTACGSDKTPSPDAAPTIDGPAGAAPKYMTSCTIGGTACESPYTCYDFNSKGPHCSKTCSVATDCPAPSTGCSGMGICKVP